MGEVVGTEIKITPVAGAEAPVKQADPNRPAWLQEKFKTPEELAKSYGELEKKLSELTKTPATPVTTEPPKAGEVALEKQAEEAVQKAGLDMKALQEEYRANGDLTAESLKKLADAGIDANQIAIYKRGMEAQRTDYEAKVLDGTPNADFTQALNWASKNMSKEDAEAFDRIMVSGDAVAGKLAVKGLMADFKRAQGPQFINGQPPTTVVDAYASRAEHIAAMGDPRYAKDPAYRDAVSAKALRSKF